MVGMSKLVVSNSVTSVQVILGLTGICYELKKI